MSDPRLIVQVIQRYYDWEPPDDTGRDWAKTCCPFHGDTRPSAAVSFRYNSFRCLACKAGGTAVAIIKEQEGVSFAEAHRIAEGLGGVNTKTVAPKRRGRRTFGGVAADTKVGGPLRRVTPWSD